MFKAEPALKTDVVAQVLSNQVSKGGDSPASLGDMLLCVISAVIFFSLYLAKICILQLCSAVNLWEEAGSSKYANIH